MVPIAEPERHRTRTAAADLVPLRGPRRSPRSRHTMARSKHAVLRPRRVARHPDRRCSHAPVLDAEPVRPGHIASRRPALSKGILIPLTVERCSAKADQARLAGAPRMAFLKKCEL